jgi:hypothetical protein
MTTFAPHGGKTDGAACSAHRNPIVRNNWECPSMGQDELAPSPPSETGIVQGVLHGHGMPELRRSGMIEKDLTMLG